MADTKISAGADPGTLLATDKTPVARSGSTTAYAATMAEFASYANGAYVPNYFAGTPSMDGTGAAGTAAFVSHGDHVHPSDTTRVAKAGDTMAGFLTLSGAPTANLHAATKLYVDGSAPVGGPYLPLAGGVLTGALTPAQIAGIVGTTTNNNAAAGAIGEYLSASIAPGSAIPLSSNIPATVISLPLTAGDWDVNGWIALTVGATTTLGAVTAGISTTAATLGQILIALNAQFTSFNQVVSVGPMRFLLAAGQTLYLVGQCGFGVSTVSAYGSLAARRAR